MPPFKERLPTLSESLDILKSWFKQAVEMCGSLDLLEIDYTAIADFLVHKGLFTEKETGVKFILKCLEVKIKSNQQEVKICYD